MTQPVYIRVLSFAVVCWSLVAVLAQDCDNPDSNSFQVRMEAEPNEVEDGDVLTLTCAWKLVNFDRCKYKVSFGKMHKNQAIPLAMDMTVVKFDGKPMQAHLNYIYQGSLYPLFFPKQKDQNCLVYSCFPNTISGKIIMKIYITKDDFDDRLGWYYCGIQSEDKTKRKWYYFAHVKRRFNWGPPKEKKKKEPCYPVHRPVKTKKALVKTKKALGEIGTSQAPGFPVVILPIILPAVALSVVLK